MCALEQYINLQKSGMRRNQVTVKEEIPGTITLITRVLHNTNHLSPYSKRLTRRRREIVLPRQRPTLLQ